MPKNGEDPGFWGVLVGLMLAASFILIWIMYIGYQAAKRIIGG